MKKGTLKKKGDRYYVKYKKSEFKTSKIDIPTNVDVKEEWVGSEVEFELTSGAVSKISSGGQTVQRSKKKKINIQKKLDNPIVEEANQTENRDPNGEFARKTKKKARAPYNFVPLPEKVALLGDSSNEFDQFTTGKLSGRIDLEIENLTPLFIRQISDGANSFGYDNKYGIPGSSLRGMIRTLSEILSQSKFGPVGDQSLYYRAIFHKDPQNDDYKKQIGANVIKDRSATYSTSNAKAGFLKEGTIIPCKKQNGNTYTRSQSRRPIPFTIRKDRSGDGWVITTGNSTRKNAEYHFHPPDNSQKLQVPDKVLRDFKLDENRAEEVEKYLKECSKKCPHGIPVFYSIQNGEIIHFGHTPFYRIPYKYSIKEKVPKPLRKSKEDHNNPDIVESLFGEQFEKKMIASRLSFGDYMAKDAKTYSQPQLLKILASPKPTTFQHYLEQTDKDKIQNYNSKKAKLGGYKLYWHRGTDDSGRLDISWKESDGTEEQKSHSARVKPIHPGASFQGSIWFQNLSKVELGMLLEALEPSIEYSEENTFPAHKIGLAKPLGLGSIKINVQNLNIIDIEKAYQSPSFFSKGICRPPLTQESTELFKKAFQSELLSALKKEKDSIWDLDRLQELKSTLRFNEKEAKSGAWLQKTRYMEIEREGKPKSEKNEFGLRPVLPQASDVPSLDESKFI